MSIDDLFVMQKSKPAADGGKTTRRRDRRQAERVQAPEKGADGLLRDVFKAADLALPEIALKFFQVAPVGIDGIAGESGFDADVIEITPYQCVRIHCRDDSQSFQ